MKERIALALVLLLAVAGHAAAQETGQWRRLFPSVRYFSPLIADVQELRLAIGLTKTDVFETAGEGRERPEFAFPDPEDAASDVQASASLGVTLPFWHIKEWPGKGGILLAGQVGVFARFRIEYPTREDTGEDWYFGVPIEFAYNRWSGRVRLMHRSSHIGDELVEVTRARRIEFGGEYADFLLGYSFIPHARVYAGATYNFRSYTEHLPALRIRDWHDTGQLQAGVDGLWYGWSNGHFGVAGGVDWQSYQRTNWQSVFSVAAGPAMKTDRRSARLLARYYNGPSSMGEFFLTPETFWSLEFVLDF